MASTHPDGAPSFRTALPGLVFLTGLFFFNFFGRVILGPFLPMVEADLGLTHAQSGGLFFFVTLGYSLSMLLSGFAAKLLGHRDNILASASVMAVGLFCAAASSTTPGLAAGLCVMGLGGGLYFPSAFAVMHCMVAPGDMGKALSVHELAPNLSVIIAPVIASYAAMSGDGPLVRLFSWRGAMVLTGAMTLALGLVWRRFGLRAEVAGRLAACPAQTPTPRVVSALFRRPDFQIMACLFTLGVASSMGPYSMLPTWWSEERGMPLERVTGLLATSRVIGLGAALVAGWAADRFGARTTMTAAFVLNGLMVLGLTAGNQTLASACMLLQPAGTVLFFPAAFATMGRLFPPPLSGVAIALVSPLAVVLGAGLAPTLIGAMGDRGLFQAAFFVLGGLTLACSAVAWRLKPPAAA